MSAPFGSIVGYTLPRWAVCCNCAGVLLGVLSLVLGILLFVTGMGLSEPVLAVLEYIQPGVDAPDNWALALTYCARLVTTMIAMSLFLLVAGCSVAWFKMAREMFARRRTP